jgi:hypothetical protein
MGSKLSEIWSGLFIPDPDPDYLPILDSGSRGQKGTGFRIRIRNTARLHFLSVLGTVFKRGAKLLQMLHSFSSILSFLLKHTLWRWVGACESSSDIAVPVPISLSAMFKIQTYCIWIRMLAFFRIRIWTGSMLYWIRINPDLDAHLHIQAFLVQKFEKI